jgi:DNA processing protein
MKAHAQAFPAQILETDSLPSCLRLMASPPHAIYMKGRLPASPRVALVGARRSDAYGLQVAHRWGQELAQVKVAVVSGGAAGVDTAALQGCLDAGGTPVAVLGTGIDVAYPACNKTLFEQVASSGALLSEYPSGTPGYPKNFPRRNRLISALADGVVVIRAEMGSGSLITADYARKQGRVLMAMPGSIEQSLSAGTHQLIREGAVLVRDVSDVLAAVGLSSQPNQTRLDLADRSPESLETLDLEPMERLILSALSKKKRSIDELCHSCDLESSKVSSQLLLLELKGLVVQLPGLKYARTKKS